MSGLVPGIHVFHFFLCDARTWMAGHRRAEATPSFRRLCPAMTRTAINIVSSSSVTVAGVSLVADLSGALFWEEQRLLVVSDLHLEKGSSFAMRGVLLPPYDTVATLGRLGAVIARHNPRTVIALGDSFHDRDAHDRLSAPNRDIIAAVWSLMRWRSARSHSATSPPGPPAKSPAICIPRRGCRPAAVRWNGAVLPATASVRSCRRSAPTPAA